MSVCRRELGVNMGGWTPSAIPTLV